MIENAMISIGNNLKQKMKSEIKKKRMKFRLRSRHTFPIYS
jgi:hypothetical protein